jgi:WD40 repeat protein
MRPHLPATAAVAVAVVAGVLAPPAAGDPAAPVNGRIAYTTFESNPGQTVGDIWTMNPDGGDKLQIVFAPTYDAQADWSPDGTRIAYRSMRGNRSTTPFSHPTRRRSCSST